MTGRSAHALTRRSRQHEIAVEQANVLEATHLDLIAYAEAGDDVWAALAGSAIPGCDCKRHAAATASPKHSP